MKVVAIDPGQSGAVACIDTKTGSVRVADMPTMGRGSGSKRRVNAALLCGIVATFDADAGVVEEVSAMPRQGVASTFAFGEAYGTARTAIIAAGLPIHHVRPRKWKGHFGLGKSKDASRTRAVELYPELAGELARVKDDGRAEAVLIARWFIDTQATPAA